MAISAGWPVNELGEVVAVVGTGSSNIEGVVSEEYLSVDNNGRLLISNLIPANVNNYAEKDFLEYNLDSGWKDLNIPSPYSASSFEGLNAKVQKQLVDFNRVAEWTALTEDQRKGLTHPSVLAFDTQWNGYKYWLAYTPYPAANSFYENPCIAGSNDGINFEVPKGVVNPLIEPVTGSGYNADTHLILDESTNTMIMIYRERNAANSALNKVRMLTSKDGRKWTDVQDILVGAAGTLDFASPSIFKDKSTGKWVILAHNLDNASWPIMRYEATVLAGPYTQTGQLTLPSFAGRKWWHSFWQMDVGGNLIGLVADNNGSQGAAGDLYLATSRDGGISAGAKKLVGARRAGSATNSLNYRSTFYLEGKVNKTLKLMAATLTGTAAAAEGNITNLSKQKQEIVNVTSLLASSKAFQGIALCGDDFARVDNATSLGSDYTGKVWTQIGGGADVMGIKNNAAYGATAASCRAVIDLGVANYEVSWLIRAIVNEMDLYFGFVDSNNFYRVNLRATSNGENSLSKIVAGVTTTLSSGFGNLLSTNKVVRVKKSGSIIDVYLDGELVHSVSDTAFAGTKVGIRSSGGSTSYIDAIVAEAI